LLLLRVVVGFGFMAHGIAKWQRGPAGFGRLLHQIGVPLPTISAWVVTVVEVLGGLAILLGVLMAVAGIPLIVTMLVAMFTVHFAHGFSSVRTIGLTEGGPVFAPPGYEINLVYIAALLVLAVTGPGPFSLGALLRRRRRT
jgi:putative oxidoreductase